MAGKKPLTISCRGIFQLGWSFLWLGWGQAIRLFQPYGCNRTRSGGTTPRIFREKSYWKSQQELETIKGWRRRRCSCRANTKHRKSDKEGSHHQQLQEEASGQGLSSRNPQPLSRELTGRKVRPMNRYIPGAKKRPGSSTSGQCNSHLSHGEKKKAKRVTKTCIKSYRF